MILFTLVVKQWTEWPPGDHACSHFTDKLKVNKFNRKIELEIIWEGVAVIFDHQVTSNLTTTNQSWLLNISNFWLVEFMINQKLKKECFGRNQKKSNSNNRKQFFQFATEAVQLSMRKNSRICKSLQYSARNICNWRIWVMSFTNNLRGHPHMISDILGPFLTYLPTHIRF